jgi:hypothetical protein
MIGKRLIAFRLLLGVALSVPLLGAAADLKSPDLVRNGLRTLAYVQDDMARKLPSKSYSRLPHENQEFQEAAVPLREAVSGETPKFRAKVDAQLKKAQAAANKMAEISATNDEARITAAVQAVADALKPLNELFPEALRPVPGQLGPGPGRGGPPPDLR